MIKVTRLNNSELWVNADRIEFIEATPDTTISLIDNIKIVVKESPTEIVEAVIQYKRRLLAQSPALRQPEA